MKPSIGRIVIVTGIDSNGSKEHPAVITRVWSDKEPVGDEHVAINATVFPDCGSSQCQTSVPLFASREAAARGTCPIKAFWPDRV